MTIATFTPPVAPSPGTTSKPKLALLKASFGDGYTQVTRNGTNWIRDTLTLTWDMLTPTDALTIINFLKTQGGDTPFWYTPSDETVPVKWTCEIWDNKRIVGGLRTVTATFEQCFNLVT